ncbi:hypothetical protein [Streptomyces sp. NPDC055912]|uniref:hypothetical protein n=1 Tax=Streptomyces sp. NPDC055912 TaxID=3345660 RepID=UPI0035E11A8D
MSGRRLRGTFVVVPVFPLDAPLGSHMIRVHLGDGPDQVRPFTPRPDEPVVNGVRIHGASELFDPDRPPAHVLASRISVLLSDFATRRIPDGARTVLEAVIPAIVRHWSKRPDRNALVRAARARDAESHIAHETRAIEKLEGKLAAARIERTDKRRRSAQISGLIRRHQPPVRPVLGEPVQLPMTASDGRGLGLLTVREVEVNTHPGRVVYAVNGPRVRGLFTVGPDRYGSQVIPQGLYVSYGRSTTSDPYRRHRGGMPHINGVTVHGGWNHAGTTVITPTEPPRLPARVPVARDQFASAPSATTERASAVLRAVALHYLDRPDLDALRIAVGKQTAAARRQTVRDDLAKLRGVEAALQSSLSSHLKRLHYFASSVPPVPPAHRADTPHAG